jgi:hypothetical protein
MRSRLALDLGLCGLGFGLRGRGALDLGPGLGGLLLGRTLLHVLEGLGGGLPGVGLGGLLLGTGGGGFKSGGRGRGERREPSSPGVAP